MKAYNKKKPHIERKNSFQQFKSNKTTSHHSMKRNVIDVEFFLLYLALKLPVKNSNILVWNGTSCAKKVGHRDIGLLWPHHTISRSTGFHFYFIFFSNICHMWWHDDMWSCSDVLHFAESIIHNTWWLFEGNAKFFIRFAKYEIEFDWLVESLGKKCRIFCSILLVRKSKVLSPHNIVSKFISPLKSQWNLSIIKWKPLETLLDQLFLNPY